MFSRLQLGHLRQNAPVRRDAISQVGQSVNCGRMDRTSSLGLSDAHEIYVQWDSQTHLIIRATMASVGGQSGCIQTSARFQVPYILGGALAD